MDTPNQALPGQHKFEDIWIPVDEDCHLSARLWRSADPQAAPVLIECLPYRKTDATYFADAALYPALAAKGYNCLRIDLRGTGQSQGLAAEPFSPAEIDDTLSAIDWCRDQDWCSGEVGLLGMSWGGTHALLAAARQPKGLKAVVALCASDDLFEDFFHFRGGCLLNQNLGWSAALMGYNARPPLPDGDHEDWRGEWLRRLEALPFYAADWLQKAADPDYWGQRSVSSDHAAIDVPVLAVGGWNDAFANVVPRLLNKLQAPAKAIIGPWAHFQPHTSPHGANIDYPHELLRWFDFWIKGQPTGVFRDPALRAFIQDTREPDPAPDTLSGEWIGDFWPPMSVEQHHLYLTRDGLREEPGAEAVFSLASPQDTGCQAGELCIMGPGPEFPGPQAEDDEGALVFDSGILGENIDIFGAAELQLELCADQPVAKLACRLSDVHPDGAVTRITYAVVNLTWRDSAQTEPGLEPHKFFSCRIIFDDVAWRLPKGHKLRLSLSTSYWPLLWPAPEPVTVKIRSGPDQLQIPIRRAGQFDLSPNLQTMPAPQEPAGIIHPPAGVRQVSRETSHGVTTMRINDDLGTFETPGSGLIFGSEKREIHSIGEMDPLAASAEVCWVQRLEKDDWAVRIETRCAMTCDREFFHLEAQVQAYDGKELIFDRDWQESIARGFN